MIFVVNDLHGQPALVNKTVNAIYKMSVGDTLIVNGDGAGSRGPKMNRLVKIFYEVRRGETGKEELIKALTEIIGFKPDIPDTWIFDSAHVALFRAIVSKNFDAFKKCVEEEIVAVLEETIIPISKAARERGVRLLYSPGNGEIVPSDFSTEDITVEKTLRPEERFYQRLADQGYFEKYAIEYIPRAAVNLENRVGVISSNLLDFNWEECRTLLQKSGLLTYDIKKLVVHYPPAINPVGGVFQFWIPNKVDRARIEALNRIVKEMKISYGFIYFGHIHLGAGDPMSAYPNIMGFELDDSNYGLWVKPGSVVRITD